MIKRSHTTKPAGPRSPNPKAFATASLSPPKRITRPSTSRADVADRELSEGSSGPSDVDVTDVRYDEHGRAYSRHEDGVTDGAYKNQTVVSEFFIFGRETASNAKGYRDSGNFEERTEVLGFNELGQATGRKTEGKGPDGDYSSSDTGLIYDSTGELVEFDRQKAVGDKTHTSRWKSKGKDAQGRSLGFVEYGKTFQNGKFLEDFTTDNSVGAYTDRNQTAAYSQTTIKTLASGIKETVTVNWGEGTYDARGRNIGFVESQTTTLVEKGTTKTLTTSRQRSGATYSPDRRRRPPEGHDVGL